MLLRVSAVKYIVGYPSVQSTSYSLKLFETKNRIGQPFQLSTRVNTMLHGMLRWNRNEKLKIKRYTVMFFPVKFYRM